MRIGIRKNNGFEYVYFLESYRDAKTNQPRTRTIKRVGRLDKLLLNDPDIMQKLNAEVAAFNKERENQKFKELEKYLRDVRNKNSVETSALSSKNYGISIYREIWDSLRLDTCIESLSGRAKYDLPSIAFLTSALRNLKPCSKLATFEHRDDYIFPFDNIKGQDIYKALEPLGAAKDAIELHLHKRISKLYKREISVAFYDVTTYYFESVCADELKTFGFSKDHRVNEVQVVMGLLIDNNGIPLGYDLYPGNTSEFKALEPALKKLRTQYKLNRVIIVADRGLSSKSNLLKIKKMGFEYVIAYKLRGATKDLRDEILLDEDYTKHFDRETGEFICKHKIIDHRTSVVSVDGGQEIIQDRLLVHYSLSRHHKDMADRERLVQKAKRLVENPSQFKAELKKGGKSYVVANVDGGSLRLDEARISAQAEFDGYYGIVTSDTSLEEDKILELYHGLWKIEESFRVMKTNLEARPCYVWTEASIRGHFVICYLALVMQRLLEYRLRENMIEGGTGKIIEALQSAKVVEIETSERESYFVKVDTNELYESIAELFGMSRLHRYNSPADMNRKLGIRTR